MSELSSIYIRARNKEGKWGSYSLQEILDKGFGREIVCWFKGKIYELVDLREGATITKEHVEAMVDLLESCGTVIYRLKEDKHEQDG